MKREREQKMAKRGLCVLTLICFSMVYGFGDWSRGYAGLLSFGDAHAEETQSGKSETVPDEKQSEETKEASEETEPSKEEKPSKMRTFLKQCREKKWIWISAGALVAGGVVVMLLSGGGDSANGDPSLPEPPKLPE